MDFKVRGCRKHVNTKHRWLFYFGEKPNSKDLPTVAGTFPVKNTNEDKTSVETAKHAVKLLPSFLLSCDIGEVFTKWLTGNGGGCRKDRAAQTNSDKMFKVS